jgi:transcriptional regulator of arginine metabolism
MPMNQYSTGDAARRKDEILRIVRDSTVHSQDEILAALRKRGFKVTQPTLSRDLRDLGLAKTPSGYIVPGDVVAPVVTFTPREVRETRLEHLIRDTVLSAEAAMNLVVIKTPAAAAQPLASAIDYSDIEDLVGTIGGDDTIFVAFRTPPAAASFVRRVHDIAGLTPERRHRA